MKKIIFSAKIMNFTDYLLLFLMFTSEARAKRKPRRNNSHRRQNIPPISQNIEGLLSASLVSHRVQACDGERVKLLCPDYTQILVETAFYGRLVPSDELCPNKQYQGQEDLSCHALQAKQRVISKCQGKRKCRLNVRSRLFGSDDPCPGTGKYLQISYKCRPSQFTNSMLCQGVTGNLSCEPGKRLAIHSAMYGRSSAQHQQSPDTQCPTQRITKDCTSDVLAQLVPDCYAQKQCSLSINDDWLGSPCAPGVDSYLHVIYICVDDGVFSEAALEGRLEVVSTSSGETQKVKESTQPMSTTTAMVTTQKATTTSLAAATTTTTQQRTTTTFRVIPTTTKMTHDVVPKSGYVVEGGHQAPTVPPMFDATNQFNNDGWASFNPTNRAVQVADATAKDEMSTVMAIPSRPTVVPNDVPNAIALLDDWIRTYEFIMARKEKVLLYFCLSASVGVIMLLAVCIARQCFRNHGRRRDTASTYKHMYERSAANQFGVPNNKVDDESLNTHSLLRESGDSRLGMLYDANDIQVQGAPSFIRFNNTLTPPKQHPPPPQHQYYSDYS